MADNPILDRVSGFAAQPVTRQLSLLIALQRVLRWQWAWLIGLPLPPISRFMDR